MITKQGKRELSEDDQKAIEDIIEIGPESISAEARAHLNARRSYLTEEIQEQFGLGEFAKEKVKDAGDSEGSADDNGDKKLDYSKLKKPELIKECEKRGIELEGNETVKDMIETLIADDNGELEEE